MDSGKIPRVEFLDTTIEEVNKIYAYIKERPTTPYYKKRREINNPLYGGTSFLLDKLNQKEKELIKKNSTKFTAKRQYGNSYYINRHQIKLFFEKNNLL
jgi:hypothetical protein